MSVETPKSVPTPMSDEPDLSLKSKNGPLPTNPPKKKYLVCNSTFATVDDGYGTSECLSDEELDNLRRQGAEIGERVSIHRDAKVDFTGEIDSKR